LPEHSTKLDVSIEPSLPRGARELLTPHTGATMVRRVSARKRYYEIDVLRFAAATSVMLYHYLFFAWQDRKIAVARFAAGFTAARYGYLGVELFFMISGFVILLTAQRGDPMRFVRSRVIRLYPAYWICVTLTAGIIALWGSSDFRVTVGQYLVNLTMFQKLVGVENIDGVYWTLLTEIKFYALVWLVLRFRALPLLRTWVWLWLMTSATTLVLPHKLVEGLQAVLVAKWAPYFSIGIACFLLRRDGAKKATDWLLLASAGLLAVIFAARRAADLSTLLRVTIAGPVAAAVVACMVLVFAAVAVDWTRFLRWSSLETVGALTYPIYLLHAFVGYVAMERLGGALPDVWFVALLCIAMIAFAYAVHRYGERPLARWMRARLEATAPRSIRPA
jgi:peptidoglycan/LPS O-acetylase OafA/YrhL